MKRLRIRLGKSVVKLTTILAGWGAVGFGDYTATASATASSTVATTGTATDTFLAKSSSNVVRLNPGDWINMHMINDKVGWAVLFTADHGGAIIRTTDSGKSWYDVSPIGTSASTPNGFLFINGNNAWFTLQPVTKDNLSKPYLMLYHTTDGGRTWNSTAIALRSEVPVYQTEISVVNSSTMYMDIIPQHGMNSMPGQLTVSHDGGKSWSIVKTPNDIPFGGSVEFVNATTGWLSTSNSTTSNYRLYETTDGGTAWKEVHVPAPKQFEGYETSLAIPQFSSSDPNNGILQVRFEKQGTMAEHDVVYLTKDGGMTWAFAGEMPGQSGLVSFPTTSVGIEIPLTSSKTLPTLYETTNGGKSWRSVTLPTSPFRTLLKNYIPAQMDFASKSVGWVNWGPRNGESATNQIWMTTDGGHTWKKVWS
ncbi:MAG: hypothetical protein K6T83_00005 [Alicyclobacillus sp.]|nr:hypothetical protein [Alicyclobacillus sp.]